MLNNSIRLIRAEILDQPVFESVSASSLKTSYCFSVSLDNKLLHLTQEDGLTLCDPSVMTTETLIDPDHLVSFLRLGVHS